MWRSALGRVHRTDLALSLTILALVGAGFYLSTTFEEVSPLFADTIQPEFFPRLLLWTIGILALLLPFEHAFRSKRGDSGLDEDRRVAVQPIAYVTFAAALVLVAAAEWLGTYLTLMAICFALPLLWGERRWVPLTAFALGFPTAVMVLFTQAFQIYFQPGVFGLSLN